MYVCLCVGVSDSIIKQAISNGCKTVKQVRDATCAATQCCKCVPSIQEMLREQGQNDAKNGDVQPLKWCS